MKRVKDMTEFNDTDVGKELAEFAAKHGLKYFLAGNDSDAFATMTCECEKCAGRFSAAMTAMLMQLGRGQLVQINPATGQIVDNFEGNADVIH